MNIREASDSKPGQEQQETRSAGAVRYEAPGGVVPRLSYARPPAPPRHLGVWRAR